MPKKKKIYWHFVASVDKIGNMVCRIRSASYKGRGRPKKSDFVYIKHKDVADFRAMEVLYNGFSTSYSTEGTN